MYAALFYYDTRNLLFCCVSSKYMEKSMVFTIGWEHYAEIPRLILGQYKIPLTSSFSFYIIYLLIYTFSFNKIKHVGSNFS